MKAERAKPGIHRTDAEDVAPRMCGCAMDIARFSATTVICKER